MDSVRAIVAVRVSSEQCDSSACLPEVSPNQAPKTLHYYILPVTALESYHGPSIASILVGSGTVIQIVEVRTARDCGTIKVFNTQSIHGISNWKSRNSRAEGRSAVYLVWGGRSLRVIEITSNEVDNTVAVKSLSQEAHVDDWILDVHCLSRRGHGYNSSWEALILSSHNYLYLMCFQNDSTEGPLGLIRITRIAVGPTSMLYSANMTTVDEHTVFIASGTVFGEILLWTICLPSISQPANIQSGRLLQKYRGHEGSVFGVKLLNSPNMDPLWSSAPTRISSCSDDRTVGIWGCFKETAPSERLHLVNGINTIAETGFGSDTGDHSEQGASIATAIGHSSRIWGLLPFPTSAPMLRLLTFGEDGTTQVWNFANDSYSEVTKHRDFRLQQEATKAYHTGKNIWAAALLHDETIPEPKVMTGGADSRVVVFDIDERWSKMNLEDIHVRLPDLLKLVEHNAMSPMIHDGKPQSPVRSLFQSMQGEWSLLRTIRSKLPTYPSGVFRGIAKLTPKEASNSAFDLEYLYEEEGSLTTEQGLSLRGTRHYVYRYQEETDTISAWFVKPESKSVVDYLFHEVKFSTGKGQNESGFLGSRGKRFRAQGHHLCIDDDYDAEYEFMPKAGRLDTWSVKYKVTGPKKDYTLSANYTRLSEMSTVKSADKQISQTRSEREEPWTEVGPMKQVVVDSRLKAFCWLNGTQVLATTDSGHVVRATLIQNSKAKMEYGLLATDLVWEYVGYSSDLSSQALVLALENSDAALLTGKGGILYSVSGRRRSIDEVIKFPSKATSLFVETLPQSSESLDSSSKSDSIGAVAICLDSSSAFVFRLRFVRLGETKVPVASAVTRLILPANTTVTSAYWLEKTSIKALILGSRTGTLFIFTNPQPKDSEAQLLPVCVRRVHFQDSITVIQSLPAVDDGIDSFLLTAGRDGRYAIHRVLFQADQRDQIIGIETVHEGEPPFGPNIEGAMFDAFTKDLILWGFKGRYFVVWNESKERELMEVDCGGAHRNWSYHRERNSSEGGKLIWTQASACHVRIHPHPSHRVLKAGIHGREIKAIAVWPYCAPAEGSYLIATGAEDTAIRITKFNQNEKKCSEPFEHLGLIRKHRTGIQQLRWSPSGRYLFSAGGYEELYVWRMEPIPGVGIGITQNCQCPPVSESCDLRVTDFDIHSELHAADGAEESFIIGAAYSDSTVRV